MAIKLIVGLGNPEASYKENRHNYGFMLLDYIVSRLNVSLNSNKKLFCQLVKANIKNNTVYVSKPSLYMNASGQSVRATTDFYNIKSYEVLVLHDDIDLDLGRVKLKLSGGHGGHNGVRDIISKLSADDFYRLRLGISRPERGSVINFVLGDFTKNQKEVVINVMADTYELLESIITGDTNLAMQKLHSNQV